MKNHGRSISSVVGFKLVQHSILATSDPFSVSPCSVAGEVALRLMLLLLLLLAFNLVAAGEVALLLLLPLTGAAAAGGVALLLLVLVLSLVLFPATAA
jgi:hypothetical protein